MGHTANIIDFRAAPRLKAATAAGLPPGRGGYSDLARLIPGLSGDSSTEMQLDNARSAILVDSSPLSFLSRMAGELRPRFLKRFQATMVVPAILDIALIVLVCVFETRLLRLPRDLLSLSTVCIYISAFLIFSI